MHPLLALLVRVIAVILTHIFEHLIIRLAAIAHRVGIWLFQHHRVFNRDFIA